jgi:hypothetical protein
MEPLPVALGQNVKQERLDIIVQRFMVQKQLGQQAEILTVDFIRIAVDFEHRELATAIYFCAWWMTPRTFVQMTLQH